MSEKSLRSQIETLMPLLADEEMELETFVEKVKPSFEVMNSNAEHDRSSFIKKWNADHKVDDNKDDDKDDNKDDDETKALKEQIAAMQKRLDDADKAKKDSDTRKDFIADRDRLEKLISDGRKQIEEIDVKIEVGDNRKEIIERYTNLKHLTREMVEILIDYISVGKRIPKTKDVPIEIHWNF